MHDQHVAAPAHDGDLARGPICAETRRTHAADTAHTGREREHRGGLSAKHLDIVIRTAVSIATSAGRGRHGRATARARTWADSGDLGLFRHVREAKDVMLSLDEYDFLLDERSIDCHRGARQHRHRIR